MSRSYLAEVTPQPDQSGVLGTFNAASSMGFILGPMVGGRLAETSGGFYKVALLCTVIFVLNAGEFVIIIVPVHFAIIYNSCFFFFIITLLAKFVSFSLFQYLQNLNFLRIFFTLSQVKGQRLRQ